MDTKASLRWKRSPGRHKPPARVRFELKPGRWPDRNTSAGAPATLPASLRAWDAHALLVDARPARSHPVARFRHERAASALLFRAQCPQLGKPLPPARQSEFANTLSSPNRNSPARPSEMLQCRRSEPPIGDAPARNSKSRMSLRRRFQNKREEFRAFRVLEKFRFH